MLDARAGAGDAEPLGDASASPPPPEQAPLASAPPREEPPAAAPPAGEDQPAAPPPPPDEPPAPPPPPPPDDAPAPVIVPPRAYAAPTPAARGPRVRPGPPPASAPPVSPVAPARRQIVAIGGEGLSPPLVSYVLGLARFERPRVAFLSTASGDSADYVMEFYEAFTSDLCEPSHLALFGRPAQMEHPRRRLLAQDVIFVGGGNTANMLAVWRAHGIDAVLRGAWEAGIVLCGASAGAICWFEGGVTDSFGPALAPLADGLGFLAGSHCPHFDVEPERSPAYLRAVRDGVLPAGVAADNGVGLHFVGTELHEVVSARRGATAYRVWPVEGGVGMQSLARETRYVGPAPRAPRRSEPG